MKRILYHGTTELFRADIEKSGLIPRRDHGNSTYKKITFESRPDFVYLSDKFACFYAGLASDYHGGNPMLLRVEVEEKYLYPDEEFIGAALRRRHKWTEEVEKQMVPNIDPALYKTNWPLSLDYMGTCAVRRVYKKNITGVFVFDLKTDVDIMIATGWDSSPITWARMGFKVSMLDNVNHTMSYSTALEILFNEGPARLRKVREEFYKKKA